MRNLMIDVLAGLLVTLLAVYDFGVPECYAFIAFSGIVLLGELYAIYRVKTHDGEKGYAYRPKVADWYDLGLGVILAVDFVDWLGKTSPWTYVAVALSIAVSANAAYNLFRWHQNGEGGIATNESKADATKSSWWNMLIDMV